MEGMDAYPSHPARDATIKSMKAVEGGDREAWLALWVDDGVVEDPIGPSTWDQEGKGFRGKAEIGRFWDEVISQGRQTFSIRESYAAGNECANVGTITTAIEGIGKAMVDGVFTYRITDDGRLAAMRAFWEHDKLRIESD